ncbi:hypothetical protein N8813_04350 [bacterium]|nr:hypothetical protein [bacterium]MDC0259089.1 hypothetical protein [Verrucomicrobiales bacterium]MDC0275939.1 hypothetical protein [Verrucomicrobiales bacterium]MDC0322483.1 hypothetical protein [Verrucomicrobiales bacterium]
MPSRVPLRDRTSLEAMHTGSLLSHMRKLQACEESFSASDRHGYEAPLDPLATEFIEFKDCDEWREAHLLVKDILAQREHLPTAEERRIKRLARAQSNNTKER